MTTTNQRIVPDERVQKALDFLADSAIEMGKAREKAKLAESRVKIVEAFEFKMSDASSNDKRQADARTSKAYEDAVTEDAVATGELAKLYALREAAAALIEAWRTEGANYRSMRI